jgi:hypothetical protein
MGADSGLLTYNLQKKHLNYRGHNIDQVAAIDTFGTLKNMYGLFVDSKQRFWFCTWPAEGSMISCFDNANRRTIFSHQSLDNIFTYYHEPRYFVESQGGTIWLYGTGMIGQYEEALHSFSNIATKGLPKTIYNNIVTSMFEDREQNLWVCTHSSGIYQFNPSAQLFKSFPHQNLLNGMEGNGGIMSFFEEEDGSFLYSAWGDGLFRCDSSYKQIPLKITGLPDKNNITAWDMCQRKDGTVWMGLQDGKLIVYNPVSRTGKLLTPLVFEGPHIAPGNRRQRREYVDRHL